MSAMPSHATIAELLLRCEEDGLARKYGEQEVRLSSEGRDLFVISDLHLAAGKGADGTYSGTENFFNDAAFQRFLQFADRRRTGKSSLLVINGDFIDFLRITDVPRRERDFAEWSLTLQQLGISKTADALKSSLSKKEKRYGLKTDDYKSIWQLARAVKGHPLFFDALAGWLSAGHLLAIVKGNHDLAWYWPGVRNYLRLILAERLARAGRKDLIRLLREDVLPKVLFVDDALVIDETFYIEHGHRYDKYSHVVGAPLLKNRRELNLPFGSFFNRYLLNQIELAYPFIDNVRPRENLLPLLLRERFFLGVRVLFQHIPFMLRLIPKRYYRYLFRRLFWYSLPVIALCLWTAVSIPGTAVPKPAELFSPKIPDIILSPLKALAWAVCSYFFTRIVVYFQLVEPSSLAEFARKVFGAKGGYRFITFGHTHNPDQFEQDGRWFFNTGTWMPIVEMSTAKIRHDKTYTFVHLSRDPSGNLNSNDLQRWNDDAGRAEPVVLIKRKGE